MMIGFKTKTITLERRTNDLMVMFCPNKVRNNALTGMRIENLEQAKVIKQYKKMYSAECQNVKNLKKKISDVQQESLYLKKEIQRLKRKLIPLNNPRPRRQPRQTKDWEEISSERTKCRRLAFFKELLMNTLRSMKVCHRAEVYLWLDDNRIHFSFSPSDLVPTEHLSNIATELPVQSSLDHTYCAQPKNLGDSDHFQDLNYSEIYDCSANWQKSHIRRIIYVMDCFRISHEAYHELRMVSKGHLPPIGRLSKEKKIMSEEIPYQRHPKVNISK